MSSSNLDQMCCSACGRISTEPEEVITCGNCGAVYHSSCIRVPTADEEWCCLEECWYDDYQPKDVPGSSARTSCEKPDAATGSETPEVAKSALDQEATEFDAERWLREKQKEIEMELAERQAQIDRELRAKEAQMAEAFQEKLRRQEANLELELKKKEEHVVRLHELETSYRRRSSLLDEQLELSKFDFGKFMRVVGLTADEAGSPMADEDDVGVSESSEGSDGSAESRTVSADEEDGVMLKKQGCVEGIPDGLGQRCSGRSEKELARRRRRKRTPQKSSEESVELLQCTGSNQMSVIARGMSALKLDEHQDRLEDAVRENVLGKFLPFWSQTDMTNLCPPWESPEQLQKCGPERVRELERPESDKFARRTLSAVNRLCDDVGAADGTFHLVNPLSFLVSKLPDGENRIWGICVKTETEKSMCLLSAIVDTGTVNGEFSPIMIPGPGAKRDTTGPELRWLVQMDSSKSGKTIKKYDETYNQLQVCNDVEKLPVDERMRIVSRWKRRSGEVCELESRGPCVVGGKLSALAILPVELRSVQEILVMQRTAAVAHAWPSFTDTSEWATTAFCAGQRIRELEEALAAKYGNDVAADNGRIEEIIVQNPEEQTIGNVGRTTNPKAAIGKPDTVDSNSIQRDVHEQSKERKSWIEDGRHGEIRKRIEDEPYMDFGKSGTLKRTSGCYGLGCYDGSTGNTGEKSTFEESV